MKASITNVDGEFLVFVGSQIVNRIKTFDEAQMFIDRLNSNPRSLAATKREAVRKQKEEAKAHLFKSRRSSSNKPTHVYLFKGEGGYHKIGVARQPKLRLLAFANLPWRVILLESIILPNRHEALKFESILHERYMQFKVKGEWFALPDDKLLEVQRLLQTINQSDRPPSDNRPA